jgi:hypothetical protein
MKFLLPQSIGGSVWALHKVQGVAEAHGDPLVEIYLACQENSEVERRALPNHPPTLPSCARPTCSARTACFALARPATSPAFTATGPMAGHCAAGRKRSG